MLDRKTRSPLLPPNSFSKGFLGNTLPGGIRGIEELGCGLWLAGFVMFLVVLAVVREFFF